MNLQELTAKLASGATPCLLSCAEAGMSEGPCLLVGNRVYNKEHKLFAVCGFTPRVGEFDDEVNYPKLATGFYEDKANARFIAATNGERPVCELLWKIYGLLASLIGTLWVFSALKGWCDDLIVIQHEILLFLSAANRLGWEEKKEGE